MPKPIENINLDQWMTDLPYFLQHIPLTQLAIPGSHDSGSYALDITKEISPDLQSLSRHFLIKYFPILFKPIIKRWSKTQAINIYTQLKNGIRHFDIRVAYRAKDNGFYFVHGLFSRPIFEICQEINKFLNEKSKEIVLIDFQHFYNFNQDHHLTLIQKLKHIFNKKICPKKEYTKVDYITLSELWAKNYQVIICYRKDNIGLNDDFWPSFFFPNPWANTYNKSLLFPFISNGLETRSLDKFFITQAIFTPINSFVAKNFASTLHSKLAIKCNKSLDGWLQYIKRRQLTPNIIIADYIDWQDYIIPKRIVFLNYKYVK